MTFSGIPESIYIYQNAQYGYITLFVAIAIEGLLRRYNSPHQLLSNIICTNLMPRGHNNHYG